jgi:hypothetical protein
LTKTLTRIAVLLAGLAACFAVAVPAASAAGHSHRALVSTCHNPIQMMSNTLLSPQLSWYWNGTHVVESTGYTVLCQIPGTVNGTSVEQYRFKGTSTCATQNGTTSIVGEPCSGLTTEDWVVTPPTDTWQYTIAGGTSEAAQGNGAGNNITFQPVGTGGDQSWGECISPGNC